jgi:microcystin-dependent protein
MPPQCRDPARNLGVLFPGRVTTIGRSRRRIRGGETMSEPFLSEIRMFGFDFPPRGWAFCDGQILSIAQNTALFALLGTTYGGNGTTVFALPDLRGRTPLHFGQGPGLQQRSLGELGGEENQTLQAAQLPMHGHGLTAAAAASVGAPDGARLAAGELPAFRESVSTTVPMAADAIGPAGGGQPHPNMQPSLGINFSIALEGVFPSRD